MYPKEKNLYIGKVIFAHKLRFLFLTVLCLAGKSFIFSQNKEDSLLKVLNTQKEDTNRVVTLNNLSWNFYSSNSNRSLMYAQQALKLSESLSFKKGIAYCA